METSQFETLMLAITGLKSEFTNEIRRLESKMDAGFASVSAEFKSVRSDIAALRKDVSVIREQTANLTERVARIEDPHPSA